MPVHARGGLTVTKKRTEKRTPPAGNAPAHLFEVAKLPFGANGKVAEFFIGKCCENTDISTVCWQSVRGIYSEKAFDA